VDGIHAQGAVRRQSHAANLVGREEEPGAAADGGNQLSRGNGGPPVSRCQAAACGQE
jgi:hypothetical protein